MNVNNLISSWSASAKPTLMIPHEMLHEADSAMPLWLLTSSCINLPIDMYSNRILPLLRSVFSIPSIIIMSLCISDQILVCKFQFRHSHEFAASFACSRYWIHSSFVVLSYEFDRAFYAFPLKTLNNYALHDTNIRTYTNMYVLFWCASVTRCSPWLTPSAAIDHLRDVTKFIIQK
jgi:hypothetical protein